MERPKPYIGVTGPTTTPEVIHLVDTFTRNFTKEGSHQPMIGFLVSHKTLNGEETANRRYPAFSEIATLLSNSDQTYFNTIHYNTRQLIDLDTQLAAIFSGQIYTENLCRGVQLNIPWPPIDQLINVKRSLPDLKIILQLSHHATKDKSAREIAKQVATYGKLIEYTLIDPSGGRGKEFETNDVLPIYSEIRNKLPQLGIGVAGGFTGDNVTKRCEQICSQIGTTDISIDAEGGLRDKITETYGDDIYNPTKGEKYVKEAQKTFYNSKIFNSK